MAHSTVLLKPNVANILLFNFCEQKFVQYGPITIVIDCNDLSLLIFEKKWPKTIEGKLIFNWSYNKRQSFASVAYLRCFSSSIYFSLTHEVNSVLITQLAIQTKSVGFVCKLISIVQVLRNNFIYESP